MSHCLCWLHLMYGSRKYPFPPHGRSLEVSRGREGSNQKSFHGVGRGFIKGRAQGKLTACEHEFARLFLTVGFQRDCTCYEHVHPLAWVLSPDALLLQILMNPLGRYGYFLETHNVFPPLRESVSGWLAEERMKRKSFSRTWLGVWVQVYGGIGPGGSYKVQFVFCHPPCPDRPHLPTEYF